MQSTHAVRLHKSKRGHLISRKGLVQISFLKSSSHGNAHVQKRPISEFLTASFDCDFMHGKRLMGRNAQALALSISPGYVAALRATVAGSVLSKQAKRWHGFTCYVGASHRWQPPA